MRKNLKKLLGVALASALIMGTGGITTYAADTIEGTEVGAGTTTNSNSATAVTSYSRPATIKAQAFVSYTYNDLFLERSSSQNTASIGGVSATAYVGIPGGAVTGGRGEHYITTSSGTNWHKTTRTGHTKN
ncbi:MAG: hypothetical protein HFJ08_10590 [Lachnospiraceae bacterium]|nr:hypothetical protein [Lachnospiraceae bacterium]